MGKEDQKKYDAKDLTFYLTPAISNTPLMQEAFNLQDQGINLTPIIDLFQVKPGEDLPVYPQLDASDSKELQLILKKLERDGINISVVEDILGRIRHAFLIAYLRDKWKTLKRKGDKKKGIDPGFIYKMMQRYGRILQQIEQDNFLPQDVISKISGFYFFLKRLCSIQDLEQWNSELVKGNEPKKWKIWNWAIVKLIDEICTRTGCKPMEATNQVSDLFFLCFPDIANTLSLSEQNILDKYKRNKSK